VQRIIAYCGCVKDLFRDINSNDALAHGSAHSPCLKKTQDAPGYSPHGPTLPTRGRTAPRYRSDSLEATGGGHQSPAQALMPTHRSRCILFPNPSVLGLLHTQQDATICWLLVGYMYKASSRLHEPQGAQLSKRDIAKSPIRGFHKMEPRGFQPLTSRVRYLHSETPTDPAQALPQDNGHVTKEISDYSTRNVR
jgi:hypothetical protein